MDASFRECAQGAGFGECAQGASFEDVHRMDASFREFAQGASFRECAQGASFREGAQGASFRECATQPFLVKVNFGEMGTSPSNECTTILTKDKWTPKVSRLLSRFERRN